MDSLRSEYAGFSLSFSLSFRTVGNELITQNLILIKYGSLDYW